MAKASLRTGVRDSSRPLLASVTSGRALPVFGDGAAERDYLFVGDLVDVVRELLPQRDVPRVLNVGSGRGATVNEVVATVESVTGRKLLVDPRASRPGDVSRVVLDTTLLRSVVDLDPLSLMDGIALTWAALVEAQTDPR